jgi:hypothetical protein
LCVLPFRRKPPSEVYTMIERLQSSTNESSLTMQKTRYSITGHCNFFCHYRFDVIGIMKSWNKNSTFLTSYYRFPW